MIFHVLGGVACAWTPSESRRGHHAGKDGEVAKILLVQRMLMIRNDSSGANAISLPSLHLVFTYLVSHIHKLPDTITHSHRENHTYLDFEYAHAASQPHSSMSPPRKNHAVVIGATGLLGWAVVDDLLSANSILGPSASSGFARITALVNRPVGEDELFWPEWHPAQPKLLVVDGVDLTREKEKVVALLRERIPDINTITHAFYFGTTAGSTAWEASNLRIEI